MNICIDEKTLGDLECLLDGYFHPLDTFMTRSDWESVNETLHLSTGEFFPLPITLTIEKKGLERKEGALLSLTIFNRKYIPFD